ncbi:MAG: hypothetical protein U9Q67_03770, partial [Patescibacteria group bacterium]|nr:hypothetical protein [Patescibacteria group bacterium]
MLRWLKILSQDGPKQVAKLVLSKLEYVIRDVNGFLAIAICCFLPYKTVDVSGRRILILMEDRFSVSSLNRVHDLAEYLRMAGFHVVVAPPWKYSVEFCRLHKYAVV